MPPIIHKEHCTGCGICVEHCPAEGAIRLRTPVPMMLSYR